MWQINHTDVYQLIGFVCLINDNVALDNTVMSQEKQNSTLFARQVWI